MSKELCEWDMVSHCYEEIYYPEGDRLDIAWYKTGCGEKAYHEHSDNLYKHCPYCGKEIRW